MVFFQEVFRCSVTLVFTTPAAIKTQWQAGAIDAAACWGPTNDFMLKNGGKALFTTQQAYLYGMPITAV